MRRSGTNAGPRAPSQRQLRVAEQVRHILVEVLRQCHFRDPILLNSGDRITITSVDIGPDLKHAAAYIMPLGGKNTEEFLDALNKASTYIRSEVARRLKDLRYMPKITFKIDNTFDEADRINNLLRHEKVQRDISKSDDEEE